MGEQEKRFGLTVDGNYTYGNNRYTLEELKSVLHSEEFNIPSEKIDEIVTKADGLPVMTLTSRDDDHIFYECDSEEFGPNNGSVEIYRLV